MLYIYFIFLEALGSIVLKNILYNFYLFLLVLKEIYIYILYLYIVCISFFKVIFSLIYIYIYFYINIHILIYFIYINYKIDKKPNYQKLWTGTEKMTSQNGF